MAQRDAARIEREKSIQAALADFFQAQGAVERIEAEAAKAAELHVAVMRTAVCTLENLEETRGGIAELTGLSQSRVREFLAATGAGSAQGADGRAGRGGSAADLSTDGAAPATTPTSR